MTIELSAQEREILSQLLDNEIAEMGPEIHHTRNKQYHDQLKQYKQILRALRARLIAGGPS